LFCVDQRYMDLFPKDYKKTGSVLSPDNSGGGLASFWEKIKNKLAFGNGQLALPSKTRETFLRLGVIISGAALVLILLLWAGLFFYKNSLNNQIKDLARQQAEVFGAKDKEIAAKIVDFDKGAALAQALLKNHIYASNLFDKLAAVTLPRVQWRSFDLAAKENKVAMKGLAADYATLARQILALEGEGFSNVEIGNISLDKTGGVSFSAAFNFDPKLLQK